MGKLVEFNVSFNKIEMIPEEFGEMSSLQKLDMRGNPIPTLPEREWIDVI